MAAGKKHHNVYVIELKREVLGDPAFRRENPGYTGEKECLYVGMTGLDPLKRFDNHKTGYKSNKYVEKYGVRLRPMLYEEYNPLSYHDAVEMEMELARILRKRGYAVWQK